MRERELEDLPAPAGDVLRAASLDLFRHGQQLWGGDVGDGLRAEHGEDVGLQPAQHVVGVTQRRRTFPVLEPGASDGLEGAAEFERVRELRVLLHLDRIAAGAQRVAGGVAGPARICERGIGIGAERQVLFLAGVAVLPPPVLGGLALAVGGITSRYRPPLSVERARAFSAGHLAFRQAVLVSGMGDFLPKVCRGRESHLPVPPTVPPQSIGWQCPYVDPWTHKSPDWRGF